MASTKRTSEWKKRVAAIRLGMSKDSEEVPPTTSKKEKPHDCTDAFECRGRLRKSASTNCKRGKPMTAQTPSSVEEDSEKAVTGRMPLVSERSVSQVEGSEGLKGQMSAARASTESDRP